MAASSGPKDVVLVIDVSGSMDEYRRIDLAKEAASTIVSTLTVADRVAIVTFSDKASLIGGQTSLIRATSDNKELLIDAINGIEPGGPTNFYDAFDKTFNALDATIRNEATTGCNIAVLFLTDGQITAGPNEEDVINLVNDKGVQLAAISYPHLSKEEIYHGVETFYKRFYFRPSKIWEIVREMLGSWEMMKRRLREGVEFFRFLRSHEA